MYAPNSGDFSGSSSSYTRQLEQDLRLLEAIVAAVSESVVITDATLKAPGPRIVFVNPAFCAMTGYSAEELVGMRPGMLAGSKTARIPIDRIQADIESGGSAKYQSTNYRKNGREYIVEWRVQAIRGSTGEVTHYLSVQQDVTERNRIRELAQQSLSIEGITGTTRAVAHDLNNLLAIILGYAGVLSLELAKHAEPKQLRNLHEIQKASEQAAALTGQLLAFGRRHAT